MVSTYTLDKVKCVGLTPVCFSGFHKGPGRVGVLLPDHIVDFGYFEEAEENG